MTPYASQLFTAAAQKQLLKLILNPQQLMEKVRNPFNISIWMMWRQSLLSTSGGFNSCLPSAGLALRVGELGVEIEMDEQWGKITGNQVTLKRSGTLHFVGTAK